MKLNQLKIITPKTLMKADQGNELDRKQKNEQLKNMHYVCFLQTFCLERD
jgi:hypothetical protein